MVFYTIRTTLISINGTYSFFVLDVSSSQLEEQSLAICSSLSVQRAYITVSMTWVLYRVDCIVA